MLKHIIKSQQFTREIINDIFYYADYIERHPYKPYDLSGKIMATLFYEPSTRTRLSFESAMLRMGGQIITTENAKDFSSAAKGENIEDTIRVVQNYADVIVLRHYEAGAAKRASLVSEVPIINAGDGPGQHPTQALIDLYTIQKELGQIDELTIAMVGDLLNGRTVRSLCYLLSKYKGITIWMVSPPQVQMKEDIIDYLKECGVKVIISSSLDRALEVADVVYQTRIQKERFEDLDEYKEVSGKMIINTRSLEIMKPKSIIMHPLPRLEEIHLDVDLDPRAAYFRQAKFAVPVRGALLGYLFQNEKSRSTSFINATQFE
jgi:aspartate carbamoyltransferase catalytic subunit